MTTLSKLAYQLGIQTLHTNCYETIHTWEPDCTKAILVAMPDALKYAFKTYASFYMVATLINHRDPRKVNWKRYAIDTLRSTAFLTINLILYFYFLCRTRHMLGFFTVFTTGGLSSTLASFFAILVEKPSRRPALALYLLNLISFKPITQLHASETLYRQMCNHGYMFTIPRGEFVPFGVGLVLLMYLYSQDRLKPHLKKFMNFTHIIEQTPEILPIKTLPADFHALLHKLRTKFGRSDHCEHEHSCASLAVESFTKNFGIGLGISSALTLLKNLRNLFTNPLKVVQALTSKGNLKIPILFGLMPLLFHSSRCLLNRVPGLNRTTRIVTSAAVSSLAMLPSPNIAIAMYTLWKGIEAVYFDLVERGKAPLLPHGDIILYTISTGYVLWMSILEPHAIRKGYQGFLSSLTGGRIKMFNRSLYDRFGYHSSKIWHFSPTLDPKFVTINPMLYQACKHC